MPDGYFFSEHNMNKAKFSAAGNARSRLYTDLCYPHLLFFPVIFHLDVLDRASRFQYICLAFSLEGEERHG